MNPDRASRALAYVRQLFPRHPRKELQRRFGLTEYEAHKVTLGRASDETIFRMAAKLDESFALFVLGKRPLPALSMTKCLWATEQGIHEAPNGLGAYVRSRFGQALSSNDDDLIHHGVVNLGWVAIEYSGECVSLKHGEAVEEMALRHTRDWLGSRTPAQVRINGAERQDYLSAMIRLEEMVGPREAMLSASWRVERRTLDAIKAPPLKRFLKLCHQTKDDPAALPKILIDGGLLPNAALLSVQGDAIVSCWAGPNLGVNPAQVMGRDLRDRPGDPRYPEMIRAHTLQTCREPEGTYHELRGVEIDGQMHDYNRASWAGPMDSTGRRFVANVVERLAA